MTPLDLDYRSHDPKKVNDRLRYAAFVSQQHGLLFIETPKVACTTMKWLLAKIGGHIVPLDPVADESQLEMSIHYRHVHPLPSLHDLPEGSVREILDGGSYARFCIVRNPYSRLASAWADKIRQVEPGFREVCRAVLAHAEPTSIDGIPTFAEFVTWVVETNHPNQCDVHWRSQKSLLLPELMHYTHVIRLESLVDDLQELFDSSELTQTLVAEELLGESICNVSLPIAWADLYNEDLAVSVARFYEDDFAEYAYSTDSWKTVMQERPGFAEMESAALEGIRARNTVIERLAQELRSAKRRSGPTSHIVGAPRTRGSVPPSGGV